MSTERVTIIIRPAEKQNILNLGELWAFRELFYMLVWRILRVRYNQTVIGAGWAIVQPFSLMLVFTFFFGFLTRIPSDGIPYALFVYSGLVMWQFVATAVQQGSQSIVLNPHLVTKIYFPRVLLPASLLAAALVDFGFSLLALLALMVYYGVAPGAALLAMPLFLVLAVVSALGVTLWFAALYVQYRDIAHILPFTILVWMFLSPIIYPASLVPEKLRLFYAMNPMVTVIEGARWVFAGGGAPALSTATVSSLVALFLVISGFYFFRRKEPAFSDIV